MLADLLGRFVFESDLGALSYFWSFGEPFENVTKVSSAVCLTMTMHGVVRANPEARAASETAQ
jgi:hypothetical protein